MGSFDWAGLVAIDRLMAQILCGTYFALAGVVCMNLYIALLSDTFARVYAQAQSTAVMQQAQMIILLEEKLNKFLRSKFGHYMQNECSPQVYPLVGLFLLQTQKVQILFSGQETIYDPHKQLYFYYYYLYLPRIASSVLIAMLSMRVLRSRS